MFGTSGVRGPVGEDMTADLALSVGRAIVTEGASTVVVGRDARESGGMLKRALIAGVEECGGDVIDVGIEPTPTVARSVEWHDADAGVVITASHNPPADNGIKLWTPSGQAFDARRRKQITEIIENEAFDLASWDACGTTRKYDGARKDHQRALLDAVSVPGDLSVVVDLGNGVGRLTADILHAAGCDVETLNGQRDGRFPGRPSEPTAETCATTCELVQATDANLGIAHDGDADRMMAIDERGEFVSGDTLLALFAVEAVEKADKEASDQGVRVAVPVDTSLAVADALAEVGAEVSYTPVGDVYVAERASASDVVFGGEPSGAWIWPDQTLCPDGPLAACTLANIVAEERSLTALADRVPSYPIRRGAIETDEKSAVMDSVREFATSKYGNCETLDGVRVDTDEGWFLVRASGTQPIVRVTAEARDESIVQTLYEEASAIVEQSL